MTQTYKYQLKGHVAMNNRSCASWPVHMFDDQIEAKRMARELKEHLRTQDYARIITVDPEFTKRIDGDPVNGQMRIYWDVIKIEWSYAPDGVMGHGTGERKGMQI